MHLARSLVLVGCVTALAACGGGIALDQNSTSVRVASELPAPDTSTRGTDFSSYRIGPMDKIAITVFDAPELAREGEVDAAGNF